MATTSRPYQICSRCIMDTTDPDIRFDEHGVCNHCHRYDQLQSQYLLPLPEREVSLKTMVSEIQRKGRGRSYDCVIGISGGIDSTYLAYKAKELGLRPLAVHLDNGWDSELAVSNIEKTLKKLGIDLVTRVLQWEEFRDLQISFLRSSTPDVEIPTDHAIVALLYQTALQHKIPYIVIGTNIETEAVLPPSWSHGHSDWRYISSIHKKFGTTTLRSYPHFQPWTLGYLHFIAGVRSVSLLNLLPYNKGEARKQLEEALQWRDYGGKHYESVYTRFVQGFYLPKKFGFDKRRAHLSSLICAQQLSRPEAMVQIEHPDYQEDLRIQDMEYVLKKLRMSSQDFEVILNAPNKSFYDYPSYEQSRITKTLKKVFPIIGKIY